MRHSQHRDKPPRWAAGFEAAQRHVLRRVPLRHNGLVA